MAKKSTTKAKPKTRVAKTTKPKVSRAAKVPAKAVTTKAEPSTKAPVKVVAAKVTKVTSLSPLDSIRRLLAFSAALYILLAALAGYMMTNATYQLTAGYITRDELASKTSTVFAPATRIMFDIELRWVVVALMLFSALFPILYLTRLQRGYSRRLEGGRVLASRWVDFAISGALLVEITALLSGMQDIGSLKLAGGLVAVSAVFSWLAERRNENLIRPLWAELYASLASLVLVGLVIAMYAASTPLYGAVRSPGFVYGLYAILVVSFALIVINQVNQHRRFRSWSNYLTVERNHLAISLVSKAAFAVALIVGLAAK